MKKICIATATRAEYGLLKPLIRRVFQDQELELSLLATGSHLSKKHGYTVTEIEKDGFPIARRIPMNLDSTRPEELNRAMAGLQEKAGDFFAEEKPDFLLILGDRYEMLSIAIAAMMCRIPIGHMHGGETTEGAIDEAIRHAITKMSYLHFTSLPEYRKRVIQLGEAPERVFMTGALGVENILHMDFLGKEEIRKLLGVSGSGPYAMVTFHPVTLEAESAENQLNELLEAMKEHKEFDYIVTFANADEGGNRLNEIWQAFAEREPNVRVFASLGVRNYLSALKEAAFVMGNSSSGIIEAPSFQIPVINIGDRQKGRIQAGCTINCPPEKEAIAKAIEKSQQQEFQELLKTVKNPYGDGHTSQRILETVKEYLLEDKIALKKAFYDSRDKKP